MTSAAEPGQAIFLLPLDRPGDEAGPSPLRRWLGREAWRADPVVWLRCDNDGDRVIFRLIDTLSTAEGFFDEGHPPDTATGMFLGFDGTTGAAWPTSVALTGFGLHCEQRSRQLSVVRALVGDSALDEALALRRAAGGEQTVRVPPAEAAMLIRRWGDLVVPYEAPGPNDDALDAAVAEWVSEAQRQERHETGRVPVLADVLADPGRGLADPGRALAAAAAGTVSRVSAAERSSREGERPLERHTGASRPTGGGVTMAGRSRGPVGGDPLGALRYGPLARFTDIWAARRDGRAGIPLLPAYSTPGPPELRHGITPYLEIRNRHFLDCAEREHQRMLADLDESYRRQAEVRNRVTDAEEQVQAISKRRAGMADAPAEPERRNMLELHAPESLVRARRQREHDAERRRIESLEAQARREVAQLRDEDARLSRVIATRERLLNSHVRQLLQHARRRCGTYLRHLVHHHPDGGAVIPYLELSLPNLPDWLPTAADTTHADGSAQPRIPRANAG